MTSAARADRYNAQWALVAELNHQHFRELRGASLRWLAAASFPIWLQAQFHVLPRLLVFWSVLAEGLCLLLFVASSGLETLWGRRSQRLQGGEPVAVVHVLWGSWEELRSALWHGIALVSLLPLTYVGLGRPFPSALLAAAVAAGVAILILLVVAETIPRLGARAPNG